MVTRTIKSGDLIGLGTAVAVVIAILLGWPPLAARSPEVAFTVVDRPGEPSSGRAAILDYAEAHRFKLLGSREEAARPDSLYFQQFFRLDSHIFVSRGFRLGETQVEFRRSVAPMSRSAGEIRLLAENFKRDMIEEGLAVEVRAL